MSSRQPRSKAHKTPVKATSSGTPSTPQSQPTGTSTSHEQDSETSSTIMSERPPSPLTISRIEEKDELGYLNDRLATYIDYVRSLETANEMLTKKVSKFSETSQCEVTQLRNVYENEIDDLRRALDDASNGRAIAEVKQKAADAGLEELKRTKKLADDEIATLKRHLDSARKQLESETYNRTKLENNVTTLQERIHLLDKVHQEELNQMRKSSVMEVTEEVKSTAKREFESRLMEELRLQRLEFTEELEAYRENIEADFQKQCKALHDAKSAQINESAELREVISTLRKRNNELTHESEQVLAKLNQLRDELDSQRRMYEEKLQRMREMEESLRDKLEQQIRDFTDLMAVKVALDQEILSYRKLLESEESRCRLTPPRRDNSFANLSRMSRKRTRVDLDDDDICSSSKKEFKHENHGLGHVSIEEVDADKGLFVKIKSLNDAEDVCLGNWQLTWNAGGENQTVYKFNRSLTLKPSATVTIWSSESDTTHSPPNNLVMKGQKFFTGKEVVLTLVDMNNVEQAGCTVTYEERKVKQARRSTRYHSTSALGRGGNVSGAGDDRCGLM